MDARPRSESPKETWREPLTTSDEKDLRRRPRGQDGSRRKAGFFLYPRGGKIGVLVEINVRRLCREEQKISGLCKNMAMHMRLPALIVSRIRSHLRSWKGEKDLIELRPRREKT